MNSDTLKQLFQSDELTNDGLNFMNAYMDSYLNQDIKNAKIELLAEMKAARSYRQNGKQSFIILYTRYYKNYTTIININA